MEGGDGGTRTMSMATAAAAAGRTAAAAGEEEEEKLPVAGEAVRHWEDLLSVAANGELNRRDNRDVLMKKRIETEVRLAQARDALFRKRSDLQKISPEDSTIVYEEFGREAVVRGELMAAISAAVEATAVENEVEHLENVIQKKGTRAARPPAARRQALGRRLTAEPPPAAPRREQ